jgi:hypothetical protein
MAEAIEAGGGTVFQVADWHDDDEVTTTFGTLKQGMAEAAQAEQERIVALLRNSVSYCTDEHSCEDCEPVKRHIARIKGERE